MRSEFSSRDLFNVVSSAAVGRKSGLVLTANPLQAFPLRDRATVPRVSCAQHVTDMRLSRDERMVAVAAGETLKIVELASGRDVRTLTGHRQPVTCLTAAKNNPYAWVSGSMDNTFIYWDIRTHPANVMTVRCGRPVNSVELSPDDSIVAVGTDIGFLLYDLKQRKLLVNMPGVSVLGTSFHPSEYLLATFGADHIVRFWDLETFTCVSMSEPAETEIRQIAFAPNGDLLLSSTDSRLHLLSWEPCNVLASTELPVSSKVVSLAALDQAVDLLCAFPDRSISLLSSTYEELLSEESDPEQSDRLSTEENALCDQLSASTQISVPPLLAPPTSLGPLPSPSVSSEESESDRLTDASPEELPETEMVTRHRESEEYAPRRRVASGKTKGEMPPRSNSTKHRKQSTGHTASPLHKSPFAATRVTSRSQSSLARSSSPATGSAHASPAHSATIGPSPSRKLPPRMSMGGGAQKDKMRTARSVDRMTREACMDDILAEINTDHSSTIKTIDAKRRGVRGARQTRGVDASEGDGFLAACAVRRLNRHGWSLASSAQMAPRIATLLCDPCESTRQAALDALTKIVTDLGDAIRCAIRPNPSIGVDVAAEQRTANGNVVHKELLQIQMNAAFMTAKMSSSQKSEFETVMRIFESGV